MFDKLLLHVSAYVLDTEYILFRLAAGSILVVLEQVDVRQVRAGKSHKKSARENLLIQKCPQLCVIFDKTKVDNFH